MKQDLKTDPPLRSAAFEDQVISHMDVLYAAALRFTRNKADAQDLLQDSVVRALRFHHKYQEGTYIKAWLLTILRNTFINNYRKKLRRPVLVEWSGQELTPEAGTDPDMEFYSDDWKSENVLEYLGDDIRSAVDSLPEGHRQAVILADLQSMSYREIATVMDCPLGTVMSRLHRGRRLLRDTLESGAHCVAYS